VIFGRTVIPSGEAFSGGGLPQTRRDALCHLKIHHGFERMRLRGLSGACDEFLLAATVQNLKTLRSM
jgi:hypothetical protein